MPLSHHTMSGGFLVQSVFLVILLCAEATSAAAAAAAAGVLDTTSANNDGADAAAYRVLHDMSSHQFSTRSGAVVPQHSPQCWMASIVTVNRWNAGAGQDFCASMTPEQQKVLALEITHCQLLEEERTLFDVKIASQKVSPSGSDGPRGACLVGSGDADAYSASSCLPIMSEYALNLYHQILLHSHVICTRLTDEQMNQQKEEVSRALLQASTAASQQIQGMTEVVAAAVESAQMNSILLKAQSYMIRMQTEDLQQMQLTLRQEEERSITALREQTEMLEYHSSMIREQKEQSNLLHRSREDAYARTFDRMTKQTSSFFEEYSDRIKTQHQEMELNMQNREKRAELVYDEATAMMAEIQQVSALMHGYCALHFRI